MTPNMKEIKGNIQTQETYHRKNIKSYIKIMVGGESVQKTQSCDVIKMRDYPYIFQGVSFPLLL